MKDYFNKKICLLLVCLLVGLLAIAGCSGGPSDSEIKQLEVDPQSQGHFFHFLRCALFINLISR